MGEKVAILETYRGIDIELWLILDVGYLYQAFINNKHEFFDRYRDARIQITLSLGDKK